MTSDRKSRLNLGKVADWNTAGSTGRTHDVATGNTDGVDGIDTDTGVGVLVNTDGEGTVYTH